MNFTTFAVVKASGFLLRAEFDVSPMYSCKSILPPVCHHGGGCVFFKWSDEKYFYQFTVVEIGFSQG
jgi:hypothetical protein